MNNNQNYQNMYHQPQFQQRLKETFQDVKEYFD